MFVKALRDKQNALMQSAVLGLASSLDPAQEEDLRRLRKLVHRSRHVMARNFGLIALGEIGGAVNRDFLLQGLDKANESEVTFRALALAISFVRGEAQMEPDRDAVARRFWTAFLGTKDSEVRGAHAVALGILGDEKAAPNLLKALRPNATSRLAGPLCVALGLLGHGPATEVIQKVLQGDGHTDTRRQAAMALGLLGDSASLDVLERQLRNPKNDPAVLGAVARAFARIGGTTAGRLLLGILEDGEECPAATRATAASALGLLVDKSPIPLLRPLREDFNDLLRSDVVGQVLTLL